MRSMKMAALLLAAIAPSGGLAQQPSVQQQFETASDLLKAAKWAEALAAFEALEARLANNARSLAVVRVRKGDALHRLGRNAEAVASVKAGLADLPATDQSLREDRYLGIMFLGNVDAAALDYASAVSRYASAEAIAKGPHEQIRAAYSKLRVNVFIDPEGALRDADRIAPMLEAPEFDGPTRARFWVTRGRILLNLGRHAEAKAVFGKAVAALGGLSLKVDVDDIVARSDYAIAAMLSGDEEGARKYLAYTGAGRFPDRDFMTGAEMMAPPCGGPDGLQPDDVAVVEFSIGDDGAVTSAQPIYASRRGEVALEFARVAAAWSWSRDELKNIPAFFRALTRVEIRCSTSSARPSVVSLLMPALDGWLAQRGVKGVELGESSAVRRLAPLEQELAKREKAGGVGSLELVPVLTQLAGLPVLPSDRALAYAERALAIVEEEKAPAEARLALAQFVWRARGSGARDGRTYPAALQAALTDPGFSASPHARSALRLMLVDNWGKRRNAESATLLREVADDAGLAPNDPFRVGALIRLASQEQRAGNIEVARAAFEKTGLAAEQCALADAPPALKYSGASSSDFPDEAMRWGFSGWAVVQYDVTANGVSANQRTLMAYPPFVFGKAAVAMTKQSRWEASYRPAGGLGCGGSTWRVRFIMDQ